MVYIPVEYRTFKLADEGVALELTVLNQAISEPSQLLRTHKVYIYPKYTLVLQRLSRFISHNSSIKANYMYTFSIHSVSFSNFDPVKIIVMT
jgi:hypothetical protein